MSTAAMIAEIATAIATRMTITLRRDLEERLAAVSRSLLPVMESCSPRFFRCWMDTIQRDSLIS